MIISKMAHKIYERLPINEAETYAQELFPIGGPIIINLNEDLPNGCPAIVIGHLIDKDSIEKSIKLLIKNEITFLG